MGHVAEKFSETKSNAELNRSAYSMRALDLLTQARKETMRRNSQLSRPAPMPTADEMVEAHKEFQGAPGNILRMEAYAEYIEHPGMETDEQRATAGLLHERAAAYHRLKPELRQKAGQAVVASRLYHAPEGSEMDRFRVPDAPITDPALRHPVLRNIDEFGLTGQAFVEQMRMDGFRRTMSPKNIDGRLQIPMPEVVRPLADHLGEGHPKLKQKMLMEGATRGIQHLYEMLSFVDVERHYGAFTARAAVVLEWKEQLPGLVVSVDRGFDLKDPGSVERHMNLFIENHARSLPAAHEASLKKELRGAAIDYAFDCGHIEPDDVARYGEASSREAVAQRIFEVIDANTVPSYRSDHHLTGWNDPAELHETVRGVLVEYYIEDVPGEHASIPGLDDPGFEDELRARGLARLIQLQALTDTQAEASYGTDLTEKARAFLFDS